MGIVPSGPWRRLERGATPPALGPYQETPWLYKYADLYRSFAAVGVPPPTVNAMTPAEAAAALGVGFGDDEATGSRSSGPDTNRGRMEYLYDLEQWKAADPETRGPEPQPPPVAAAPPDAGLLATFSGG